MTVASFILALVTMQRLGELLLAQYNTRRLRALGAVEAGANHYLLLVSMHAAWLIALWLLGHDQPVDPFLLLAFIALQGMRWWVLSTLGSRWTTRIIVLPGAPLVTGGPYRYMSHPNYAIVTAEIALLPLALHLPWVALIFSVLNAAMLTIRIRAEQHALVEIGRRVA